MDVKHRRQWHIHVAVSHRLSMRWTRKSDAPRQCKQNDLPMAEADALGQPGCARGMKHRGDDVFVEIFEFIMAVGTRQEAFVFRDNPPWPI